MSNDLDCKFRIGENNGIDIGKERHQMRVLYGSFSGMRAVIAILKIYVNEAVSLVAIKKTHAFANRNEVIVENGLQFPYCSDVELFVPSLMPAGSLPF